MSTRKKIVRKSAAEQRHDRLRRTLAEVRAENGGTTGPTTATLARLYPELYAPPARTIVVGGREREVHSADDVIRGMAEAMVDLTAAGGSATEADLRACGFTLDELQKHADRARTLARSPSRLRRAA